MEKFTIRTLEDVISFFKSCAHEPRGKAVPKGVAHSAQVVLNNLRKELRARNQADARRKVRAKVQGSKQEK